MPSPRAYAAFLRGISPMNASMPALRAELERAGLENAKTILTSGNASFVARAGSEAAVRRIVDAAITRALGREVLTILRSVDELHGLLEADPFAELGVPAGGKRVVTFLLSAPRAAPSLPIERRGSCIHALRGRDVLSTYLPDPPQPALMPVIEKTFGKDITTRTWDTIRKVAASQTGAPPAKRRAER